MQNKMNEITSEMFLPNYYSDLCPGSDFTLMAIFA